MATRIDDLEDFCRPYAQKLIEDGPTLKRILSAGVIALSECTAEWQQYYCARAIGIERDRPETPLPAQDVDEIRQLLKDFAKSPSKSPRAKRRTRAVSG